MKRQLNWWMVVNYLVMAVSAIYVVAGLTSDLLLDCLMLATLAVFVGLVHSAAGVSIFKEGGE